jgi:glycosyltransferase involved in cell wall biosynthesis
MGEIIYQQTKFGQTINITGPLRPDRISDKKRVSLIIPTMNEEKNIPHVLSNIPSVVDEIIIIDSSSDRTVAVIKELCPRARIIISEPLGKGNALKLGFANATGDVLVMMDADGSMDPMEIPRFIAPVMNGYDASVGSRIMGGSEDLTLLRRFGNYSFVNLVNFLFNTQLTDLCYGYRAFKKSTIEKIAVETNGFEVETVQTIMMAKLGMKMCEIPSYERSRIHGSSNLNTFRDGLRILHHIYKEWKS